MRPVLVATLAWLLAVQVVAQAPPTSAEVTIEPVKFGDVASILKVDSTVATFKFDQPVSYLALVLEARPKEPRTVHVARLALELKTPVKEGRFCVQMADQGFLPMGNGAPHQMQLFMQLDCGGTLISSSQSFLKEKFNFSRSLARSGSGTLIRKVTGQRVPVFWLMGNSDDGTYFNDDDLDKMVTRNKDAYVMVAYLETSKDPRPEEPSQPLAEAVKTPPPVSAATAVVAAALIGPPFPVPTKKGQEEVRSPSAANAAAAKKPVTTAPKTSSTKPKSSKSSKSSSKTKKRKS